MAGGTASLEIEVVGRATMMAVGGASVEVTIEGAQTPMRLQAGTDSRGRVSLKFPLPRLAADGGQLVITASSAAGNDEKRYRLKQKQRVESGDSATEAPRGAVRGRP